jgi:hypothetical protein
VLIFSKKKTAIVMTLQEYAAFTTDRQIDILNDLGERLSKRLTEEHQVTLYRLFDFFVELYFHRQQTTITNIVMFKGVPIPDAYFDNAELSTNWIRPALNPETLKGFKNISLRRN